MRNSILEQAVKLLREKRKYRYWLTAFLCLAVLVTLGTVTVLKMNGQAMSHKEKTLDCQLEIHQHTDECYDEEHNLICGQADYVVHTHNEEDCYDEEGKLVCKLPEIKAHTHGPECYQEKEELVCKLEEQEEHHHTDECYTLERGDLICGQEGIFPEGEGTPAEGNTPIEENIPATEETPAEEDIPTEQIIQTEESAPTLENSPADEVLPTVEGLPEEEIVTEDGSIPEEPETGNTGGEIVEEIADMDANAGTYEGHVHTDTCYEWKEVPACGKEETDGHTHTDECYETKNELVCGQDKVILHTHDESCYDEEGHLTCGLLEVKEHIHGAECFKTNELTAEEVVSLNNSESEKEPEKAEDEKIVKTYKDDSINVTAEYTELANIPDEAELIVKQITAESDPEHYAEREAEFKKEMGGDDANMNFLLDIGFYVDGEEVEPFDTVTVKVKFADDKAFEKDELVKMLHFAEDGTEILEGENDEEGVLVFKMDSFSEAILFANVGVGTASKATTNNPVFILIEENGIKSWLNIGNVHGRTEKQIGGDYWNPITRYVIPASEFVTLFNEAETKYSIDLGYKLTEIDSSSRWMLYADEEGGSLWSDNQVYSETKKGTTTNYWVFTNIANKNPNFAIYYMPGNTTKYEGTAVPEDFANGIKIVFTPANNNGTKGGTNDPEYPNGYDKREVVRLPGTAVKDDGKITINLPKNEDLDSRFVVFDSSDGQNVTATIQRADSGTTFKRRLVGWYNIADGQYYPVGSLDGPVEGNVTAEIDPEKTNVFYADWVAENYSFGATTPSGVTEVEAANTSSFVTTRMFDYNELFNLYSVNLTQKKVGDKGYPKGGEIWSDGEQAPFKRDPISAVGGGEPFGSQGSFIFRSVLTGNLASISPLHPNNGYHGTASSGDGTARAETGIVSSIDWLKNYLFNENSPYGVHYLGTADGLYMKNGEYGYSYDSAKNAAAYERNADETGRFHIYDKAQSLTGIADGDTAFFPLNEYKADGYYSRDGEINYYFGMSSTIDFYLPATPGSNGGDVNKFDDDPMKFEFSGDDDVWVYIDDKLVLDLGGIHDWIGGEIDFSAGEVYLTTRTKDQNGNVTATRSKDEEKSNILKSLESENHRMVVYYLERGAGGSNCKISFNIAPRYIHENPTATAVTVKKKWDLSSITDQARREELEEAVRQETIYVDLKKEDEVIESSVPLDKSTNWEHTWKIDDIAEIDKYSVEEHHLVNFNPIESSQLEEPLLWSEIKGVPDDKLTTLDKQKIVILSTSHQKILEVSDDGNGLEAADISAKNNFLRNGLVSDKMKWEIRVIDDSNYRLKNGNSYLSLGSDGDLFLTTDESAATRYQVGNVEGEGFVKSGNDRIIYDTEKGRFVKSGNQSVDSNKVQAYIQDGFLVEKVFTITNTLLPDIKIAKEDKDTKKLLTGAAFSLVRKIGTNNTLETYANNGKWQTSNAAQVADINWETLPSFQVDKTFSLSELQDGDYWIKERSAPSGYQLIDGPIGFSVAGGKIAVSTPGGPSPVNVRTDSTGLALYIQNSRSPVNIIFKKIRQLDEKKGSSDVETETPTPTPLEGAVFKLYKADAAGETVDGITEKVSLIKITNTDGEEQETLPSDVNGIFWNQKLSCGTYYLVEQTPPDGYHKLTAPIKIIIEMDKDGNINISSDPTEGITISDPTINKGDLGTAVCTISIPNKSSYELPHTGSSGTQPFTIGGAILLLAGAFLLYGHSTRQRQRAKRSGR